MLDTIYYYISVDEMLRQPWVCMGLEKLMCQIWGLARLSRWWLENVDQVTAPAYTGVLSELEKREEAKMERCRAQHVGVYERLVS